jgi:hypothetical protein
LKAEPDVLFGGHDWEVKARAEEVSPLNYLFESRSFDIHLKANPDVLFGGHDWEVKARTENVGCRENILKVKR